MSESEASAEGENPGRGGERAGDVPVVTIDGPSGAGKGTVARELAQHLGYHLLDSGAVYRAAALHVLRAGVSPDEEAPAIAALASLDVSFMPDGGGVRVFFGDEEVTAELRTELTAAAASRVAAMPEVRARLLPQQRSFRLAPGLVADGRDMGTVVFPDATLKVFLTASAETRAGRRAKQLKEKGIDATMRSLLEDIEARDRRDATRTHSPLLAAEGALVIDSSDLAADAVVARVVEVFEEKSRPG